MRKRDFKQELIKPNYRVDNNMMRRYIRKVFVTKEMLKQEIADVKRFIKKRYKRHGIITMEDNLQCLRTGNGFELIKGTKHSLEYVREELNKYRRNFAEDLAFWSEVEKDWNNLAYLINDLNEIENFNLSNYLDELRLWLKKYPDTPKKKKVLVTMNSKYDEDVLKEVYLFVKSTTFWADNNIGSRDFVRIFKTYSIDNIKKIRIRNRWGCKAFVSALVYTLVGVFDTKIVNLCFCDENGKSLNMRINHRPSDRYMPKLEKLLLKGDKVK